MNIFSQKAKQSAMAGTCVGTINATEQFSAGLVELSEKDFPAPHGTAYVLFARQRDAQTPSLTKEVNLSFSKGLPNDDYVLRPGSTDVRVSFTDNSDPDKSLVYLQLSGIADLKFDDATGVFTGTLTNVVLQNRDDDVDKQITLNLDFSASNSLIKYTQLLKKNQAA